jgi:hypothetical protein
VLSLLLVLGNALRAAHVRAVSTKDVYFVGGVVVVFPNFKTNQGQFNDKQAIGGQ